MEGSTRSQEFNIKKNFLEIQNTNLQSIVRVEDDDFGAIGQDHLAR